MVALDIKADVLKNNSTHIICALVRIAKFKAPF